MTVQNGPGGQPFFYYTCGAMTVIALQDGSACCIQDAPSGYVPTGDECLSQ